jgi:hypothetical protein
MGCGYGSRSRTTAGVEMEDLKAYLTEEELEVFLEENRKWSEFSLASAMRGMEDEETPYTLADLKGEQFV